MDQGPSQNVVNCSAALLEDGRCPFACAAGYAKDPNQQSTLSCSADSNWQWTGGRCAAVPCAVASIPTVAHSVLLDASEACVGSIPYLEGCPYRCEEGYTAVFASGGPLLLCGAVSAGAWDVVTCEAVQCSGAPLVNPVGTLPVSYTHLTLPTKA